MFLMFRQFGTLDFAPVFQQRRRDARRDRRRTAF